MITHANHADGNGINSQLEFDELAVDVSDNRNLPKQTTSAPSPFRGQSNSHTLSWRTKNLDRDAVLQKHNTINEFMTTYYPRTFF